MQATPDQTLRAALWMTGAIASFLLMAVAGRAVQVEMNTFALMFWRSLIGLAIVLLVWRVAGLGVRALRPASTGTHAIRHIVHFSGQNLWFWGLTAIPLAQLVALEFTSPIWVVLLAPLLLGESFTRRKFAVALIGFCGILIVARPGLEPLGPGHLAGLGAALCFALNTMLTRRLMRDNTVICVLFWMTLSQALMALPVGLWTGMSWPSAALWPWLLVLGVTGLSAHYCLTSALNVASASVVAPMEFIRLPLIAMVGMLVYAEALDPLVFLGAAVIFAANMLNARGPRTAR
ncbi:MAG: DMT family transporter, partial [Rhodobacteraceae bacterium]|nr:DMT family transporter [Paracoccaceae bacterium]